MYPGNVRAGPFVSQMYSAGRAVPPAAVLAHPAGAGAGRARGVPPHRAGHAAAGASRHGADEYDAGDHEHDARDLAAPDVLAEQLP